MDKVNHKHLNNLFQKQFFEKSSKKCVLSLDANKTIIMKASCVNFSFSINEQMVKKMSISKNWYFSRLAKNCNMKTS